MIILWKPMKALWQRIYKKYVAAPDENQNARLGSIEKNVQMLIDRQDLSRAAARTDGAGADKHRNKQQPDYNYGRACNFV